MPLPDPSLKLYSIKTELTMNFVSNLNFAEIMVRYTIMMILGIIAGVTINTG